MAFHDVREVVIAATPKDILAVMLDLESLPEWSQTHQSSRVLARDEAGRPTRSRAMVKTVGITDEQEIDLTYYADGYGWTLVSATFQRSQEARYTLIPDGSSTRVRFEITMEPVVPMPGFLLRRAARAVLDTATYGLRRRVMALKADGQPS